MIEAALFPFFSNHLIQGSPRSVEHSPVLYATNPTTDLVWPTVSAGPANILRQWDAAKAHILSLSDLGPNWDGHGGAAVSKNACANARSIVEGLESRGGRPQIPEISPTSSGTIAFSWECGDVEAYIEVGNTRFSGYLKVGSSRPALIEGNIDSFDPSLLRPLLSSGSRHVSSATTITRIEIQSRVDEHVAA